LDTTRPGDADSGGLRGRARAEGFQTLALMSTLPGKPLYERFGFRVTQANVDIPLPNGLTIGGAAMEKPIAE
jgi:hypothetical protein